MHDDFLQVLATIETILQALQSCADGMNTKSTLGVFWQYLVSLEQQSLEISFVATADWC